MSGLMGVTGQVTASRRRKKSASSRALTEQHPTDFRIAHINRGCRFDADRESTLDRRPRADRFEPALEVRKLREVLALPLGQAHQANAGDVGDRIASGQIFARGKPLAAKILSLPFVPHHYFRGA